MKSVLHPLVFVALALIGASSSAQTDTTFTYQGHFSDGGVPASGSYNIDVSLWDAVSGGGQVGSTVMLNALAITDGLLTVELDFGASIFTGSDRWLEISVNGTELAPRQLVTHTPYSIQTRGLFVDATEHVGIGTPAPAFPFHVETPTSDRAVFALNSSTSGTNYAVYGESMGTEGHGVFGCATAATGFTYGVRGESDSPSGHGVHGLAKGGSGTGVYGRADTATGLTTGVFGLNNSTEGRGVFGWATASTGITFGMYGQSNSASGFDFFAAGAGTNYGASSSRRWKNNVKPIGNPLTKLGELSGVYFDWDEDHGGHHDVGMIAEVVGEVLPEIVQYEDNGIDAIGMDYSKMTPLLVEAVNELNTLHETEITRKNTQIAELTERITRLESLIEQTESTPVQEAAR